MVVGIRVRVDLPNDVVIVGEIVEINNDFPYITVMDGDGYRWHVQKFISIRELH